MLKKDNVTIGIEWRFEVGVTKEQLQTCEGPRDGDRGLMVIDH
jgi:hypothetical protein